MGTVVMTGPSQYNFTDAYNELKRRGGAVEVGDAPDIARCVEHLLTDDVVRKEMQQAAAAGVAAMVGALDTTATALDLLIPAGGPSKTDERLKRAS